MILQLDEELTTRTHSESSLSEVKVFLFLEQNHSCVILFMSINSSYSILAVEFTLAIVDGRNYC